MHAEEIVGRGLGAVASGVTYAGSAVRNARLFHPEGEVYVAEVKTAYSPDEKARRLGGRLCGTALVRLSAAIWKGQQQRPDILGAAVRFGWDPAAPLQTGDVQDLLFLSCKRLRTIPLALLSTDVSDFLNNLYYSVAAFETNELGEAEFRLMPQRYRSSSAKTRAERLAEAVSERQALFTLQARYPHRLPALRPWIPVAIIRLLEKANVDDRDLLFSPFHHGRGIRPTGIVNQMRSFPYEASKAARSGISSQGHHAGR